VKVRRLCAVAGAALLAHAGCGSTGYTPRADGRIAMGMDGGGRSLLKDGKSYEANGDGLSRAVAGNLAAEAHVRSYNRGMNFALAEYFVGLGAMIAGFALQSDTVEMGVQQPASHPHVVAGVGLVFGGVAIMIVSAIQGTHAQAHFADAINVYNDGVPPHAPPSPVMSPMPPAPPPEVGAPEVTPLPMAPAQPVPAPSGSPAP